MAKRLLAHALSPISARNLHITAGARGGLGYKARCLMQLTFSVANSWASAMGTVGVEAIVEVRSRDAVRDKQEEPQDQQPQVHGVIGKAGASANWEEEENKPM